MNHFHGKDALGHVKEKRLEGSLAEPHGLQLPGFAFAITDGAKLLSSFLLLLLALVLAFDWPYPTAWKLFLVGGLALIVIFASRTALHGFARLERLHRMAQQERYEIEHHRPQERAELKALYEAKGFKDELLDKVVDVLMADDNRLLKVMLEEEMGLSLEAYEHPLKPAAGIIIAGLVTLALFMAGFLSFSWQGALISSLLILSIVTLYSAKKEQNRMISALVWNLATALFAAFASYFAVKSL